MHDLERGLGFFLKQLTVTTIPSLQDLPLAKTHSTTTLSSEITKGTSTSILLTKDSKCHEGSLSTIFDLLNEPRKASHNGSKSSIGTLGLISILPSQLRRYEHRCNK